MLARNASPGSLKGIGPKKVEGFALLGIETLEDLLWHVPFRYEDYRHLPPVGYWQAEETVAYLGRVVQAEESRTRRGQRIAKALLSGKQGDVVATWFGRWQMARALTKDRWVFAIGRVQMAYGKELIVSQHHFIDDEASLTALQKIWPVYPASERLPSRTIGEAVQQALEKIRPAELFAEEWREAAGLMDYNRALQILHGPPDFDALALARRDLAVYELLFVILAARALGIERKSGRAHLGDAAQIERYLAMLPYRLTDDQAKVDREIAADMARPLRMQRLLQGDVGSGKTTVAALALLRAVGDGKQGVLMAPTEILARQHEAKLRPALEALGLRVGLLTGSTSKAERTPLLEALAAGDIDILIGTHALLEEAVVFHDLALVVIDEQHRFGVRQRRLLEDKGPVADLLVMTATPIPRSLALTVYGDLDLSVIHELPPGRQPVSTHWLPEAKRRDLYGFLAKEMAAGRQVYVVCPLLAESEKVDLTNATALAETLQHDIFPHRRVGLLHGRMNARDKEAIMADFAAHRLDLLVATTVIEVGIDVPNASIMVIENADRFGLAQLHQLRGRIGRGEAKSYCFLFSETTTDEGRERLEAFSRTADGFAIAEADLLLRGPGELLGLRQHGKDLFRIANPAEDTDLVLEAKRLADRLRAKGEYSPDLRQLIENVQARLSS